MTSRWPRRFLVAALILLGLGVIGSTWFVHRLMTEVLTGRAFANAAQTEVGDPMSLGFRGNPQRALGLSYEDVTVDTPLGPAPAWLIPGAADAPFAAIHIHGIGGAREDGYPFLPALIEAGIPTLMITYRGDDAAPAAPDGLHSFGLTEWQDLEAAVALMQARGDRRVVLVAASMGGAIVGQFLHRSALAGDVAGVVLDAPALDFPMVIGHITARLGLPLRQIGVPLALRLFTLTHGTDLTEARVIPALADFPGPILLFHGSADRIVPNDISFALLEARQGQTTFLHTRGDHLQSHRDAPARFNALLADFLAALKREAPLR